MSVEIEDLAFQRGDEATELYRRAGRALWAFTFLEFQITHIIVLVFGKAYSSHEEVDQRLKKHFKLTLGALLQKLREVCTVTPDVDSKLA